MAINGFTVNGPAVVSANIGASHAYQTIGYTQDGVDVEIIQNLEEIITDVFGPRVPADFQDMMMMARITVPFIALDRSVLLTLLNLGDKTTNTDGNANSPGLVLGAGGYDFVLGITSQFDPSGPWFFNRCFIRDSKIRTKLSTKAHPFTMQFFAIPKAAYTVTAGKDSPLYARASI